MKMRRLFFALWPDDTVRKAIIKKTTPYLESRKGRIICAANYHVTLHYIGPVPEEEIACFRTAASEIRAEKFQLQLDSFGYFSRPGIVWLGMTEVPDELLQLYQTMGQQLEECGYQADDRAYSPHVTLMRKCPKPIAALHGEVSIPWPVEQFALLESVADNSGPHGGVIYRVVEQYPLA